MDIYKTAYLLFCDEYMKTVINDRDYAVEDLQRLGLLPSGQERFPYDHMLDNIAEAVTDGTTLTEIEARHAQARREAYEDRITDDSFVLLKSNDKAKNEERKSRTMETVQAEDEDCAEKAASYIEAHPAIITGFNFDSDGGLLFKFYNGEECLCTIKAGEIHGAPIYINGKTRNWKVVTSENRLISKKYYSVLDLESGKKVVCLIEEEGSYYIVLMDWSIGGFPPVISVDLENDGEVFKFYDYHGLYYANRHHLFSEKEFDRHLILCRLALTERVSDGFRTINTEDGNDKPYYSIKVYDEWEEFDELMMSIALLPIMIDHE